MISRQAKQQEDTYFRVMRILQNNPDLTQRELAEMCNCWHNAVNAELGRMSQRGWVELAYGQVRLLDPESILRSFQSGR